MSEREEGLDKETLDRLSREWDKKPKGEAFSIRAKIDGSTGEDVIQKVNGMSLDPNNPYSEFLWEYGDMIFEDEMNSDIAEDDKRKTSSKK